MLSLLGLPGEGGIVASKVGDDAMVVHCSTYIQNTMAHHSDREDSTTVTARTDLDVA
jgi:hypothetical protein